MKKPHPRPDAVFGLALCLGSLLATSKEPTDRHAPSRIYHAVKCQTASNSPCDSFRWLGIRRNSSGSYEGAFSLASPDTWFFWEKSKLLSESSLPNWVDASRFNLTLAAQGFVPIDDSVLRNLTSISLGGETVTLSDTTMPSAAALSCKSIGSDNHYQVTDLFLSGQKLYAFAFGAVGDEVKASLETIFTRATFETAQQTSQTATRVREDLFIEVAFNSTAELKAIVLSTPHPLRVCSADEGIVNGNLKIELVNE